VELSANVAYAGDVRRTASRVAAWESAGLDIAWVPEAYGYDAATVMGFLAAMTERIRIGSGVFPLYSRTPALLAQTAAGPDHLSGGRAILGLGASGPQVIEGWHGVPYDRPHARAEEVIDICRKIWRRERLVHEGIYTIPLPAGRGTGLGQPLKLINTPARSSVPIFLAALGMRNVALAARLADGWMPALYIPELAGRIWGAALAKGGKARAAALGPLQVVAGGPMAIGDDAIELRRRLRPQYALYIGGMGAPGRNFYFDVVAACGYADAAARIQQLYLAGRKREAEALVPDEIMEQTSLIGPASHVKERIAAYRESGVTILIADPVGSDPWHDLERIRNWL
jgi:F420-dependent oxidoreductase-like protein